MKLIYLIAGTFNAGGMERVMTQKANWLVRHGYEVTVVTTDQRGRVPYFPLDPAIQTYDLDINYDETNSDSKVQEFKGFLHKALNFPLKQWKHRKRLTALLMQLKADVVVCMFNNDVSFAYKIKDGSRKFLEIHFSKNKKLQYGRRGLWALADRWRTRHEEHIVRHYERFVVLTQEDKVLWGDLPNICVIPNSSPTLIPLPIRDGSRYLSKRVLAIGRLDYQKGFDRLIEIWFMLHGGQGVQGVQGVQEVQGVQGWTLDIVGDGPLREELQGQIEQLGLQESVHLLPPTNDIQSLYAQSSIFVLTSRYEGLPMVLLEAQAFGLPIVAFACQCGPRDIITDGTDGYLIPDGDEVLFAERLTNLMSDEALRRRMGAAAVTASERFQEDCIMQQWQEVFKS